MERTTSSFIVYRVSLSRAPVRFAPNETRTAVLHGEKLKPADGAETRPSDGVVRRENTE